MSAPKISEQEKLSLRQSAKAKLECMETILSNHDTAHLIDDFKAKFNLCESAYKVILFEHQKRKGNRTSEHPTIHMNQVKHALNFAGYSFENDLLNDIFGSQSKKGKTAKKLRDAVTHGLDEKAIEEISSRKEELFGYMDAFLDGIRFADEEAA